MRLETPALSRDTLSSSLSRPLTDAILGLGPVAYWPLDRAGWGTALVGPDLTLPTSALRENVPNNDFDVDMVRTPAAAPAIPAAPLDLSAYLGVSVFVLLGVVQARATDSRTLLSHAGSFWLTLDSNVAGALRFTLAMVTPQGTSANWYADQPVGQPYRATLMTFDKSRASAGANAGLGLYRDGVRLTRANGSDPNYPAAPPVPHGAGPLRIGGGDDARPYAVHRLAHLAIFPRVLAADEALRLSRAAYQGASA